MITEPGVLLDCLHLAELDKAMTKPISLSLLFLILCHALPLAWLSSPSTLILSGLCLGATLSLFYRMAKQGFERNQL